MSQPLQPGPSSRPRHISSGAMLSGNLVLAIVWVALTGSFGVGGLFMGFVFGYIVLYLLQRVSGRSSYFVKLPRLLSFIGFYLLEVVRSNVRVAHDVVTPASRSRPGVVAVPLDARTDAEITLLANLITMTPGSLTIDVADDRSVIYVHSMFLDDPEDFRRTIKHDFERRVLELLR